MMYLLSIVCTDINECATNNGNCAQNCSNTVGSYLCSCGVGYIINANNRTCTGELSVDYNIIYTLIVIYLGILCP